ncbi:MAG: FG-GAP-like repeat-containing protein, partial [Candidatus Pacebacteria bacterium]|nr:FG-GAP-like repeat-containing protein [Candidatus Paceibacterota bacterium]
MVIKSKNQKVLLFSGLAVFLLVIGIFIYQSYYKKNTELGDGNKEELNEQQEETAKNEENEDKEVADNIKIPEPDNLKCSIEDFAIKLSWSTPASGDNLTYKIYKKSENEEEFKKIAENIENTEYHDKTETDPYLNYSYYVTAKNSNSESDPSEAVTCKIHTEVNYKNPSLKISFLQRIFSIKKALAANTAGCVQPSPSFNPNKLVSDVDFINTSSMSVSGIQKFLETNNSVLADINPKRLCGTKTTACTNTKTAAQLIYEAAVLRASGQSVGINAGAILVTLQKEQSLITKTSWLDNCSAGSSCPYPTLQYALDWAMGYSVYEEDGTRIEELKGFKQQLLGVPGSWWGAPRSLRNNYNLGRGPNGYYLGDSFVLSNTTGYYCVPSSQRVKPTTKATMSLYRYTPHVFNGNYNFWYYWNKWKSWFPYQATSIWNFISSGSGITSKSKPYTTTTWNYSKSKFASGDVNGDGREDLVALYNYGTAKTGIWVFIKTDTGYTAQKWWESNAWNWSSTNLQVGDTNNDGKDDIVLSYKYSLKKMSIW